MAKFFLTNKDDSINDLKKLNEQFDIGQCIVTPDYSLIVFNKLIKPILNYYWKNNEGVVIVGTPMFDLEGIYKDNIPKYIYDNFCIENISSIQKNIIGIWAALVFKENEIYCFNDYYGIYDIFYASVNDRYIIGNSLADLMIAKPNYEFDEFPFIMENLILGAFPGECQFKDIHKVKRNEFLKISKNNLSIRKFEQIKIITNYGSEDDAITNISNKLINYSKLINNKFKKISMFMTGGLDSRIIFAGLKATNDRILNIHGIGNGTCLEDKKIVEALSQKYNNDVLFLNWKNEAKFNIKRQNEVFKRIGFFNWIDFGNKSYFDEFEKVAKKSNFVQQGYFCEALRLREWAEKKNSDNFSILDFVDNYYLTKSIIEAYPNLDNFRKYLIKQFSNQLRTLGYDGELDKIPMDYFEPFRWEMARYSDSRFIMMENMYMPSFPIMGIPVIHNAILNLPANTIKDGSFQIKLVEAIDPALIRDFQVFSHRRAYKIKNYKKVKIISVRSIADYLINLIPVIRKPLHKIYSIIRGTNVVGYHNESMSLSYSILPKYIDYKTYNGDLRKIVSLVVGLKYIQQIKNS